MSFVGVASKIALGVVLVLPASQAYPKDFTASQPPGWVLAEAEASESYVDQLVAKAFLLLDGDASERDPAVAVRLLAEAAKVGDLRAIYRLAEVLAVGATGVPADPARARDLVELAIANGDAAHGNEVLGDLLLADTPLRDPGQAAEAFEAASRAGNSNARIKLGNLLVFGSGSLAADPQRAADLFNQALDSGNLSGANEALGDLYTADTPLLDRARGAEAYGRAVDAGNARAARKLARMLINGDGVPVDVDRAIRLLRTAIDGGVEAQEMLGDALSLEGPTRNLAEATSLYRAAVDTGSVTAMVKLGRLLGAPDSATSDPKGAVALLQAAIDKGEASSGGEALGDLLSSDSPVRNLAKAISAYQTAADAGNAKAMIKLADLLLAGNGIPRDPARAADALGKAIEAGAAFTAGEKLGDLYARDESMRDVAKAAEAYQKAVVADNSWAMIKLAKLITAGEGMPADPQAAISLLRRAVELGNIEYGALALGDLLAGDTAVSDPRGAVDAYQKAADAGSADAMIRLARILGEGKGVPAASDRAVALLQKAIDSGAASPAGQALGDFLREKDPAAAVKAYQAASDAGNTVAMVKLGRLLFEEKHLGATPEQARAVLERALKGGETAAAAEALGDLYMADTSLHSVSSAAAAYQQAIDAGSAPGMVKLASILSSGSAGRADPQAARALLDRAIKSGYVLAAAEALGDLYSADTPIRSGPRAVAAYELAVAEGSVRAMRAEAQILIGGTLVPPRPSRAAELLESAVAGGDTYLAAEMLGDLYLAEGPLHDPAKAAHAYEQAVEAGKASAMTKLAVLIGSAPGTASDPTRAVQLLQGAIAAGEAWKAGEALGDLYMAEKPKEDPSAAGRAYQIAATAGNPVAMVKLALLVGPAGPLPADLPRARALLEAAIESGNVGPAARALGDLYMAKTPLRNPAKAAGAYRTAVDAGNGPAMIALAGLLLRGEGIEADVQQARKLLLQAISDGNVEYGSVALGDLYAAQTPLRDLRKAAAAYEAAANAGSTWAMIKLANMRAQGYGGPANPAAAVRLLQQAIDAGNVADAAMALASVYLGKNAFSPVKAVAAYQLAADAGSVDAAIALAQMLIAGKPVPADPDRALAVLEKAVTVDGGAVSGEALGDFYLEKTPLRDVAKAEAAYQSAADKNNVEAMLKLATLLAKPEIGPPQRDRAAALLRSAMALGEAARAGLALGDLYLADGDVTAASAAYEAAAAAGNPSAHLALALLASQATDEADRIEKSLAHFIAVAKLGEANTAAVAMMKLPGDVLVAAVQTLLTDRGYSTVIDGKYGAGTRNSILSFCSAKAIKGCDGAFVTVNLLQALLTAPAKS